MIKRLPTALRAVESPDPTVDLLSLYLDIREVQNDVRKLFRDLERREGARSVTIMLLRRESEKLAKLARILEAANLGDIPPIAQTQGET